MLIILLIIKLGLEEKIGRSHCGIKTMYHEFTDSSLLHLLPHTAEQRRERLLLREVPYRFLEGSRESKTVGLSAFSNCLASQSCLAGIICLSFTAACSFFSKMCGGPIFAVVVNQEVQ